MKHLPGCIFRPLSVVLGVSVLVGAPPAFAQEGALEEVVVTARYREEALQDTPLAISAMTAQELEVKGFTTSFEVAYSVPNASFRPAQAAFGNSMTAYIRGIGQYDFNFAFEPGVGMYIDDVYHPTVMGSMLDLMDLERVEVLRGPQGTLFGRGSIGGAMRMVSKKPEGDNTGSIRVTGGQYERVEVRGSYDFALTENLYARVAGVSKQREGYQQRMDFACVASNPAVTGTIPVRTPNRGNDCELGTAGGEDVTGFRGSVRWVANDDFEVTLTSDYQNDDSEVRANHLVDVAEGTYPLYDAAIQAQYGPTVAYDNRFSPDDPYTSYATFDDPLVGLNFEPKTSLTTWGVSGKAIWDVNDRMQVEAILAYREYDSKFANDHDVSPLNLQMVDGLQNFESFTGELRISGRLMDRLDYTVGYFHYDGEVASTQTVSFPGLLAQFGAPYPPVHVLVTSNNLGDFGNDSVFAHVVYDITDRLAFTAGGRWSKDTKDADFDNSIVQAVLETSEDRFDYKFGLDYKLTDDVLLYTSTATGYRPQAYNPRPFQVSQFVQVDGEEATSYDLGIKADLFDRRVRMNLAGFYVDYSRRILPQGGTECPFDATTGTYITVPPGTPGAVTDSFGNTCLGTVPLTFYVNEPGDIYGIEAETTWRPVDNLTINGIFGWTKFEADDVDAAVVDTPIYVPEINWSVSAAYDFHLGNGSTLTPRVDVIGQSEICTSTVTTDGCSDGYELVNLRLTWASPDRTWTAAVGGTNVFDKFYYYNKFDLQAFGQPTIEGQPGRPAEWYVTVQRNFN